MTNLDEEAGSFVLRSYGLFFKKQFQDYKSLSNAKTLNENKIFSPIKIGRQSVELIPITDLVSSDNILMTKVISVLTSLCVEVLELKKEAYTKHFHFISIYDEYGDDDVCNQMEAICSLSSFISRCDDTLYNLCAQVFAVYSKGIVKLGESQLHFVINHIGELLSILVLIELLISNSSLVGKWNTYCQSLRATYQTKENLNITASKFQSILEATENISVKIMDDNIVQNCLNHIVTLRKSLIDKSCNGVSTEFSQYIKQAIWNMDKLIQEKTTVHNMQKCIKINALFVLCFHLFGYSDKKTFKALMELNCKAHSIHVNGTTIWFPEQFLQRYAQSLCLSYSRFSQTMLKARQSYISSKKVCIIREIQIFQNVSVQFILDLEHYFSKCSELNATEMCTIAKTLLEGLDLASQINNSALSLINLHLTLGIPLSKTMLMSLFDMIDILKSIKDSINRNNDKILSSINMITQHLLFQGITSILEVKKSLITDKNYENKRLDELTCLVIAERAIKGALTVKRSVAANIALSFVPEITYLEDSYTKLCQLLEKTYSLTNFIETINQYCNCSWIFWHQNVLQIYLQQNFNNQLNVIKIKYFLMVIDDCAKLLHTTDVYFGNKKIQCFLSSTQNMVENNILKNTSQNIETNLRLHIHSHLQLDVISPYSKEMSKKSMLAIDIFRLCTIYLSIIPSVEHYLSTMFYNLTTVVLSDWKTYGEMRQMAKFKFNLSTVEDNLPTQTLEQGLDVLEIMRNIHIFVSKYLYNLNNQIFIEKSSNNKHLNSINIRHIANSIRTHGTGIMNTTVNFTYQFLKKKFYTLSQFMYDEHIKSRLIKDLRVFKETVDLNKNMYPYKSAERFNKGIKVLGLDEDGQSYLDLFRDLISQIGNAMGYVRMIRSGGRHCCSDATVFLPSHGSLSSFKQHSQEYNGEQTCDSAENLDQNIDVLMSNFLQGTEYFKLLVDVFSPVFRNPKNVHLKNFYIIVPPLTLNFVDHMILSKDKMSKKNKIGAAFTDDGFAMGIAYILKLLDQDTRFESLHWFDSVWAHITEARRSIDEQNKRGSVQLQQTLALTEKKLKSLEEEYKLLYYSLTSARIFFR